MTGGSLQSLQTLERGLDVLQLCAASDGGVIALSTVMQRLDLARSTAYRLVKVLRDRGFLRAGEKPGHLELGYQLVQLGKQAEIRADLAVASLPALRDLAAALNETAFVTVRSGWNALCLEQVECRHPMRLSYRKGEQLPLYAGASGKIVMAYMRAREQEIILSGKLQVFTDEKLVGPSRIRRDIQQIRRQGFAITSGEVDLDAWAICVPILLWDGKFVGGLNLAGPSRRFPDDKDMVLRRLREAAARMADSYADMVL